MYLCTHSFFSLRYGVLSIDDLLVLAHQNNIHSLALTDINNTSGCLSFVRSAQRYGIRPIVGIDFRNGVEQQFVALAKDQSGFYQINQFLSHHLHNNKSIPCQVPDLTHTHIIYPWTKYEGKKLKENEWVGIKEEQLTQLRFSRKKVARHKIVILQTVTFRHQLDFNTHRLLRAIDCNTLLSKLPQDEQGQLSNQMMSYEKLMETYAEYPELIANTKYIFGDCKAPLDCEKQHRNIQHYNQSEAEDLQHVRQLCINGLAYRYKKPSFKIYRRIVKELDIIRQKKFLSYFLINWDIVSYALSKNYFYVGRGSGANSIVAYLLRITDVDPIDLDLYFERFINLYRQNPPDFDLDFSWKDRDQIVKYIFDRYGEKHTCLLATYNTFQRKSSIRELGKVFGLPPYEIEKVIHGKQQSHDNITSLILKYAAIIEGMPSHLSIHAGGIIISDQPIHCYTATNIPPKGFPISQFDMYVAEDIGLHKFDILSQRGLGKIKDTLELVAINQPHKANIDIHNAKRFFEDEKVKDLLRNAKAIGCFYVESPAMRMLLKKLRVNNYLALVAASSIIRPGVAKSGMMKEYILRFRMPEKRKNAHPILAQLMPETFGVMVYQEDVVKVAHYFAKLDLGEADVLRRAMSGKSRSKEEFQNIKKKYFHNCKNEGYPDTLSHDIWRQIESFAGYAFAKGHSASYAIESYQSLYLKAHFPIEYMVAVINNGGGFYQTEFYIHDAKMNGAIIQAPCINQSEYLTIVKGKVVYLGFHLVNELEKRSINLIINTRQEGDFYSIEEFVNRCNISLQQLIILIRMNGLRTLDMDKKRLLWQAHLLLSKQKIVMHSLSLFEKKAKQYALPKLYHDKREDAFDEIEILNFPLHHPFGLVKQQPEQVVTPARNINEATKNKIVTVLGYLVTVKKTKTTQGNIMYFGTFIDRDGEFIDTVHFPPIANRYPFRGRGVYLIEGKAVEEFGFFSIEVISMKKSHLINLEAV